MESRCCARCEMQATASLRISSGETGSEFIGSKGGLTGLNNALLDGAEDAVEGRHLGASAIALLRPESIQQNRRFMPAKEGRDGLLQHTPPGEPCPIRSSDQKRATGRRELVNQHSDRRIRMLIFILFDPEGPGIWKVVRQWK